MKGELPFSRLVATQRERLSLSLAEVARRMRKAAEAEGTYCGTDPQTIHEYERGRAPHPDGIRWLATALELPLDQAVEAARQQRQNRRPPKPSGPPLHRVDDVVAYLRGVIDDFEAAGWSIDPDLLLAAVAEQLSTGYDTLDDEMKRRRALALVAGATGTALLPPGFRQLVAPALSEAQPGSLEAITSLAGQYRQLWGRTPPGDLLSRALAYLHYVSRILDSSSSRRDQERLASAASEISVLIAWLAGDTRNDALARQHYESAIAYSKRADDDSMQAYMVGSMSLWAATTGDGNEAVSLNARANALMAKAPPQAGMAVRQASAYASVHDTSAALRALGRAEDALDQGVAPRWPWIHSYDEAWVARYRGAIAAKLGLPEIALPALRQGLAALGPARTKHRANSLCDLAEVLAMTGEVEEACRALGEAVAIGVEMGSDRVVHRGRGVRAGLEPYRATQAVKDLDAFLLDTLLV